MILSQACIHPDHIWNVLVFGETPKIKKILACGDPVIQTIDRVGLKDDITGILKNPAIAGAYGEYILIGTAGMLRNKLKIQLFNAGKIACMKKTSMRGGESAQFHKAGCQGHVIEKHIRIVDMDDVERSKI